MEPSFRQIRYFIGVAETGKVSKAAQDLNVSQSAVTTAIKQLEEIVGTPLFNRRVRGMSLTHAGTIFLNHARRVFATLDEAIHAPRTLSQSVEGTLRLVMTYTVAGYFLPPYLERFRQIFRGVQIQMTEAPRADIEDGLISGSFDLAVLLTSNIADQESLSYETLLRSRRKLWLSSSHPLLAADRVSLRDVAEQPYIMLTVDEASNTSQRYWNHAGFRPRTIFRTSSVEAVRSMVGGGVGVTILSDMVHRPWSLDGRRVEARSLTDQIPTMDVGLAWARNIEMSAASKAFREFMNSQHLSDPGPL